jgi:hypothetical protein
MEMLFHLSILKNHVRWPPFLYHFFYFNHKETYIAVGNYSDFTYLLHLFLNSCLLPRCTSFYSFLVKKKTKQISKSIILHWQLYSPPFFIHIYKEKKMKWEAPNRCLFTHHLLLEYSWKQKRIQNMSQFNSLLLLLKGLFKDKIITVHLMIRKDMYDLLN